MIAARHQNSSPEPDTSHADAAASNLTVRNRFLDSGSGKSMFTTEASKHKPSSMALYAGKFACSFKQCQATQGVAPHGG
jgi:hypothetical protein